MTVAGPLLGTCRAELPDELKSQTTTRVVLSSTPPPLAQSVGETDKRRAQHYEDRGVELCTGAEGLNAEAESFHADANGLKMKDGASRTLPAGGGKSVCDADGGTSQMPQRTKINPSEYRLCCSGMVEVSIENEILNILQEVYGPLAEKSCKLPHSYFWNQPRRSPPQRP